MFLRAGGAVVLLDGLLVVLLDLPLAVDGRMLVELIGTFVFKFVKVIR